MSVRNLDHLFRPRSLAIIGASPRAGSVGRTVLENVRAGGFGGPIMPVNPKHRKVAGFDCYADVAALPETPDLAVVCTPPATIPGIIEALGRSGNKAAVVLTAGLGRVPEGASASLEQQVLEAARPHLLRILGPNCVGLIVPGIGLNASFAPASTGPGRIAFVTQSGALATAILDWAKSRDIGFSHFVSLGNSADVDFGDVLDYLAGSAETRAVLLYIEAVKQARKFMSAARAAARNKPVIVVKAGRAAEGARAATSHTGALAGEDGVYDAAIRRAGMLRVDTIEDLFDAAETLARARPVKGDRLAILTNGGGPGVMAVDSLIAGGGRLAALAPQTIASLDKVLPATWSKANPVDIIGDAPIERYAAALRVLIEARDIDALLFLHAPTAIVPSAAIAEAVAPILAQAPLPVFACWLGGESVSAARHRFAAAGIPTYATPEDAVRAMLQMVRYRRNQEALLEAPPSAAGEFSVDRERAQSIIEAALAAGREMLNEPEAKAVLAAYGVPVVETRTAATPEAAAAAGAEIRFPVVVKILSEQISHKSDVGGVLLNIEAEAQLRQAAETMLRRVGRLRPEAAIQGFTVQPMVQRPLAQELLIGAKEDRTFGPVLVFGHGGTAVEVIADRAIGLPPLNMALARQLITETRVARLLAGYRDRPTADLAAIALALVQVAQLVTERPEIVELDINPLLADDAGVLALDARIRVRPAAGAGVERLAIRPYPRELEEDIELNGLALTLRPIRPEDEAAHRAFFQRLDRQDVRFRFFGSLRELPHSQLARYTQIDYDREMAFIATTRAPTALPETYGVVRTVTDPDNLVAEFAIVVRSDVKRRGLGRALLSKMIRYCRARGTKQIFGEILSENAGMLGLAESLGFRRVPSDERGVVKVAQNLN